MKSSRWELPLLILWNEYRSCVFIRSCQTAQIGCNGEIRVSFSDQGFEVCVTLHCISEVLFKVNQFVCLSVADTCCRSKLVTVSEYAELTGAPSKPHEIAWMRANTVSLQQIPNLLFLPVSYWTETVNMSWCLAITQVCLVGFQDGVACPLLGFLTSLQREQVFLCPGSVPDDEVPLRKHQSSNMRYTTAHADPVTVVGIFVW